MVTTAKIYIAADQWLNASLELSLAQEHRELGTHLAPSWLLAVASKTPAPHGTPWRSSPPRQSPGAGTRWQPQESAAHPGHRGWQSAPRARAAARGGRGPRTGSRPRLHARGVCGTCRAAGAAAAPVAGSGVRGALTGRASGTHAEVRQLRYQVILSCGNIFCAALVCGHTDCNSQARQSSVHQRLRCKHGQATSSSASPTAVDLTFCMAGC